MENKRNYTITENVKRFNEIKMAKHTPKGINEVYWNDFAINSGKKESSLIQYKSAVNRFTTYIDKDILETSIEEIENYLSTVNEGKTKVNAERYIKSFLTFTIGNNIEKAVKCDYELIMSLIPTEYKMLIKVLMSK